MMFQDAFIKLDALESETVLEDINPVLEGSSFDSETVTILGQKLSFYPDYRFLDIADYEVVPHARRFIIYKPGDVVVLNGTNEPVYALNEKAPLLLDENTAVDYVQFFFSYVKGKHGRFIITETVDDIQWKEEPPPAARKAIGKMIESVLVTKIDDDGSYHLVASMMFKDSLFKTSVIVSPSGLVNLSDEELLVEDMPVLDDIFGQ